MNDKAMFKIGYGLYILTASENGRDNGCIVNTLVQVTSSPNRVTIAVNKANYTAEMISRTKAFNVSMLTVNAKMETIEPGSASNRAGLLISLKTSPLRARRTASLTSAGNATPTSAATC